MELWKLFGSPRHTSRSLCFDRHTRSSPARTHPKSNIHKRCATKSIHTIIFRFLCIFCGGIAHVDVWKKKIGSKLCVFSISFRRCFGWAHLIRASTRIIWRNNLCLSDDSNQWWLVWSAVPVITVRQEMAGNELRTVFVHLWNGLNWCSLRGHNWDDVPWSKELFHARTIGNQPINALYI